MKSLIEDKDGKKKSLKKNITYTFAVENTMKERRRKKKK